MIDPQAIYDLICPPGSEVKRYPSSGPLGTAYGRYLGIMYLKERRPDPYCIVDFWVYYRGVWGLATIYDLQKSRRGDPGVALAFKNCKNRSVDTTWRWPKRTDILDAERDEVYEIKPLASRDEGVGQLQGYIAELNRSATITGPIDPRPRSRIWTGGVWDPSRYPLVVAGASGQMCLVHAWADPDVQGLLVYRIVCCATEDTAEDKLQLAETKIKQISKPILDSRPEFTAQLEKALQLHLPKAPVGSSYAFLVPWRVFNTFVVVPMNEERDRKSDHIYSPRPGPVMEAFVLELFALGHVVTGPVTDALFVTGGYMRLDEIVKMWGFQALLATGAVVGAFAVGELVVGPAIGVAAAASPEVAVVAAGAEAAQGAGVVLTAAELDLLAAATAAPAAAPPVVVGGLGLAAGEAVATGSTLPAWMIASISAGGGSDVGTGLGMVAVLVTGFVAGDAHAETLPSPVPAATIAGADPVYLAPVELLVAKTSSVTRARGEIALDAEVLFGGEPYFIIGFAGPD